MNIISGLLSIVCIVSSGYLITRVLNKFLDLKLAILDSIHLIISIGVFFVVVPGMIIGLSPTGNFSYYYRLLLILSLIALLLMAYDLVNFLFSQYNFTSSSFSNFNNLWFLMFSLASALLIFHFLLPQFRGFDAFWRYYPQSLVFYQLNRIPLIDYLNFHPVTYEPVNTLLYTFTYYLTNEQNLIFLPPLFFIALLFLIYNVASFYFKDSNKSIIAVILFCSLPVINWMIQYWVYYEELYITYFFSVSVFYFIKYMTSKEVCDLILFFLGLSLAILSKTSGWILLPIILLILPFGKYDKKIKVSLLLIYWLILSFLASRITFFWLFIPLGLYTILLGYSLHNSSLTQDLKLKERILMLSFLILGILVGGYWFYSILRKIPAGFTNPALIYFSGSSFVFHFPLITGGYNLILEHMQAADMITSVFVLLFAVAFVPPWLIPKILGFIKSKDNFYLYVWVLIPNMIWITEFGLVYSIRYLIPITVPLIILITSGVYELWTQFKKRLPSLPDDPSLFFIVILVGMGIFETYPTIPLIFLIKYPIDAVQINNALEYSYKFNAFWLYQLVIGILSTIIILILLKFSIKMKFISFPKINLKFYKFRILAYSFIFIVIVSIVTAPFSILLAVNGFNLGETNAAFDPVSSKQYYDVVDYLINENVLNSTIFTVYVPGLSYFTNIPSLDLIEDQALVKELFTNTNVSIDLNLFHDPLVYFKKNYSISSSINNPSLGYVAIPNYKHYTFDYYKEYYSSKYYFFDLLQNPKFFSLVVSNDLYRLYKLVTPIPDYFYGIFKISLGDESNKVNLFSNQDFGNSSNPVLSISMDFSMLQFVPSDIELYLTLNANNTQVSINYNPKDFNSNGNFSILNIPLKSFHGNFSLDSISLSDPTSIPFNLLKITHVYFPKNSIIQNQNFVQFNLSAPLHDLS